MGDQDEGPWGGEGEDPWHEGVGPWPGGRSLLDRACAVLHIILSHMLQIDMHALIVAALDAAQICIASEFASDIKLIERTPSWVHCCRGQACPYQPRIVLALPS